MQFALSFMPLCVQFTPVLPATCVCPSLDLCCHTKNVRTLLQPARYGAHHRLQSGCCWLAEALIPCTAALMFDHLRQEAMLLRSLHFLATFLSISMLSESVHSCERSIREPMLPGVTTQCTS